MNKKVLQDHSRKLDQFYTNFEYAKYAYSKLYTLIDLNTYDILLEPSAGTGSFYSLMNSNKRIGLDLDPKCAGVVQQDFLSWTAPENKKIIAIGNPPFGKNSNLAVKFFQKCADFCDVIAFILPKTFRKASIINRLNKNFHLIYDEDVPKKSFIFDGVAYDVPCCFQIWKRKNIIREKIKRYTFDDVSDWFTLTTSQDADFSIQRVGQKAGIIRTENFRHYSNLSHYYIKVLNPKVLEIFLLVDFEKIKYNTAGNPSISPSELIQLWQEKAKECGLNV